MRTISREEIAVVSGAGWNTRRMIIVYTAICVLTAFALGMGLYTGEVLEELAD